MNFSISDLELRIMHYAPRILLVNPWIHDFAAFNLWARPLGLLTVAEYLSAFELDLFFIDCTDSVEPGKRGTGKYRSVIIEKPAILRNVPRYYKRYGIGTEDFLSALRSVMPLDIILITCVMSYWYPGVLETIRLARDAAPGVPIVLGGIYPTLYPDHALRNSGADHIYRGTADDRLLRVLESVGVVLRPGGRPSPYYEMDLYSRYPFAPILTSAGCPYHCSYCASKALSPLYSRRPVADIVAEIEDLSRRGASDFAFYDDALLYDADHHIKPLLEEVIRKNLRIRLHAPNGLHARFIDDHVAELMMSAGFETIRLSLETIDPERQEKTGGKIFTRDFEKAVLALQKHGFAKEQIGAYLLYGLPGQGLNEVEQGIAFLKDLNVRIHLAEFSPIRGTACWNDLVKQKIIPDDLDPLLTNNTVFSYLYSGYDPDTVERMKIRVKEYNAA